jgi:hypothetical protein
MPDMPQSVSKGSILGGIDALSKDHTKLKALLAALRALGNGPGLLGVMTSHLTLSAEERKHLQDDWFGHWWPLRQTDIQQILTLGFITAIEKVLSLPGHHDEPAALDCYWVCTTGHHDEDHGTHDDGVDGAIEVGVMWTDCHVTVLIHTPSGGKNSIDDRPLTEKEPIIVVARDGHDNNKVKAFRAMMRAPRVGKTM